VPPCNAATRRDRAARASSVLRVFLEYHTPVLRKKFERGLYRVCGLGEGPVTTDAHEEVRRKLPPGVKLVRTPRIHRDRVPATLLEAWASHQATLD
jgi:hypothetical protein